jgi:hypothetical protein
MQNQWLARLPIGGVTIGNLEPSQISQDQITRMLKNLNAESFSHNTTLQ